MNAKTLAIALAIAAAAVNAYAGDSSLSTVSVRADAAMTIDCRDERLPSREAVAALLGSNNAGYIVAQRETLAHVAHRECLRGAGNVAFIRDTATTPASLALASVSK